LLARINNRTFAIQERIFSLMKPIYTPKTFTNCLITCINSECSWTGKGEEAHLEYLFLTAATEIYCPKCKSYLGFINQDGDE
jgi:hypothetical protein